MSFNLGLFGFEGVALRNSALVAAGFRRRSRRPVGYAPGASIVNTCDATCPFESYKIAV